jgi:hypothetical protein
MDRRMLFLGIILFIAGIIASYLSVQSALGSSSATPTVQSIALKPRSTSFIALQLNQTGMVSVSYVASNSIDFIFSDATAFGSIGNSANSIVSRASSLEGAGIFEINMNITRGIFPYPSYGTQSSYSGYNSNVTTLDAGTYYAVFVNEGYSNATTVWVSYLALPLSSIRSMPASVGGYGLVSAFLILAGIILFALSFFRKGARPGKKEEMVDAEAARLYAEIEKRQKKQRTRRVHKPAARSRSRRSA